MENHIAKYLIKNKLTQSQFARLCNLSRQLVNYHLNNPAKPWTPKQAKLIEEGTKGEIEIFSLIF